MPEDAPPREGEAKPAEEVAEDLSEDLAELVDSTRKLYGAMGARREDVHLYRTKHAKYVAKHLRSLPKGYASLDASRPWILYWSLHSLALLGALPLEDDADLEDDAVSFLRMCQAETTGGFGGGPRQVAHMAATYAAVCALATIGTHALATVDRIAMARFLKSLIVPPEQGGGVALQLGGEVDVRGCYTAVAVCTLLGIDADALGFRDVVVDFVVRSQTYEGGIAGEPGAEAHGGYTFCGVAALVLLGEQHRLDLPKLLGWAARRQGVVEGGFNGRTNKLVDGCYSFWQGGVFPLLQDSIDALTAQTRTLSRPAHAAADAIGIVADGSECTSHPIGETAAAFTASSNDAAILLDMRTEQEPTPEGACALYSSVASQGWLLVCSQLEEGGFRDKPGKSRDLYHSCYCLSGLAAAQHARSTDKNAAPVSYFGPSDESMLLVAPDVALNIVKHKADAAREWASRQPPCIDGLL